VVTDRKKVKYGFAFCGLHYGTFSHHPPGQESVMEHFEIETDNVSVFGAMMQVSRLLGWEFHLCWLAGNTV